MSNLPPIVDFSPAIATLDMEFRRTGLNWNHPRVLTWMERAGLKTRYDASYEAYCTLIEHLGKLPSAQPGQQPAGGDHAAA